MSTAAWHRARRSGVRGNCVEVARQERTTAVRDSKDPAGGRLHFTRSRWQAFLAALKSGRYDLPAPAR
jgi:hypothetical protein